MSDFYLVSAKHTIRAHPYVTLWRPADCGYCWPLSWAGRYSAETVAAAPGYYNNGDDTFPVPVDVAERLAEAPRPGMVDGNAGPVIANTKANWAALRKARPSPVQQTGGAK
jgi:hypothetical protein